MKFYSGFSLANESYLFDEYIHKSEFCISGFSYGAIKAIQDVQQRLASSKRVDTLQLFSPAFFQTKPEKFKRLQLLAYKKSKEIYLNQFISSCFSPYEKKIIEHSATNVDELEELLRYIWKIDELQDIAKNGVTIEVYLGGEDKIIDVAQAREFFLSVATVTYIKNANHFLQIQ